MLNIKPGNDGTRGLAAVVLSVMCWVACTAGLSACVVTDTSVKTPQPDDATVIYLVRHAEKEDGSKDPDLSSAGQERAMTLARVLEKHAVHKLWSSDYARTRQTLLPLSEERKIPLTLYDARDSNALVRAIMQGPPGQTHVIAGHSNTVPEIVDLLEAWPKTPLTGRRSDLGHDEYDRLYVITIAPEQTHATAKAHSKARSRTRRVQERRYSP